MEGREASRRREAAWALGLVLLAAAVALVVVAYVTFVLPLRIPAMQAAGITDLPLHTKVLVQTSNFIVTKWYLVAGPWALIVVLLLARLIAR
jgi:uncharacterized membrane protein YhdT